MYDKYYYFSIYIKAILSGHFLFNLTQCALFDFTVSIPIIIFVKVNNTNFVFRFETERVLSIQKPSEILTHTAPL